MGKEEFERQLQQAVPRLKPETTEAWYRYVLEMCNDFSGIFYSKMLTAFGFLKNNFSPQTVQNVYGSISCATLLPSEMVAAAVYMQNGGTVPQVAGLSEQERLMPFLTPWSAEQNSPLALLTVQERGKEKTFYTVDFGSFQPEKTLLRARAFAKEHAIPVTNAVALLWNVIRVPVPPRRTTPPTACLWETTRI